jgi:hypothetical protein
LNHQQSESCMGDRCVTWQQIHYRIMSISNQVFTSYSTCFDSLCHNSKCRMAGYCDVKNHALVLRFFSGRFLPQVLLIFIRLKSDILKLKRVHTFEPLSKTQTNRICYNSNFSIIVSCWLLRNQTEKSVGIQQNRYTTKQLSRNTSR